ncbi:MAG: hypothetical protein QY309_02425 [Cyclobacteriaceae bacterium]|nr:MAG: hypothetical protein QY309_02425 [Cyclobacteriaceae bacterium]
MKKSTKPNMGGKQTTQEMVKQLNKRVMEENQTITGKELHTRLKSLFGDSLTTATQSTEQQEPTTRLEVRMLGKSKPASL